MEIFTFSPLVSGYYRNRRPLESSIDELSKLRDYYPMKLTTSSSFPELPSFEKCRERLMTTLDAIVDALIDGTTHAREYADRQDEEIDTAFAHNFVRHRAKKVLRNRNLNVSDELSPSVYKLDESPSNNGLCILETGFEIRTLKSDDGTTPPPGVSMARKNFYNQMQAVLNFEQMQNGGKPAEPTWGVVVHWTVDSDYNLEKICLALPVEWNKHDGVVLHFEEPIWVKPPIAGVVSISTGGPQQPPTDTELKIEVEPDEKTGEEPANE